MVNLSGSPRTAIKPAIRWAALVLVLNAVWEVVQLPLYNLASDPSGIRIALYVAHCVVGDVMIATLLFLLAVALLRDIDWLRHRPWSGGAIVVVAGVGYTIFSEWRNVYVTGAWAYDTLMPTVGGIGIVPLVQWLIVPALSTALVRRMP